MLKDRHLMEPWKINKLRGLELLNEVISFPWVGSRVEEVERKNAIKLSPRGMMASFAPGPMVKFAC